jgi:hypothetical protein
MYLTRLVNDETYFHDSDDTDDGEGMDTDSDS